MAFNEAVKAGHRAIELVKQILAFSRQVDAERIRLQPASIVKEAGNGTGMGLSVVHGIVKSRGGIGSIESEPGKGITANVRLPVIDGDAVTQNDDAEPIPVGSEYALFIDSCACRAGPLHMQIPGKQISSTDSPQLR